MGGFDFNGVNGAGGTNSLTGAGKAGPREKVSGTEFGFGFEVGAVGDVTNFSNKPAFNSYDMEQMWAMAGVTKPEGIKSLENTMNFASEGAEYGVLYSEEDMNLARFMFENLQG